jgi:hypothetical protein
VRRTMDMFVRRENIKHFRELLHDAKLEADRQRIKILLDEELRNNRTQVTSQPAGALASRPARVMEFSFS